MLKVTLDTFLTVVYEMNLLPCFLVGSRQDDNLERQEISWTIAVLVNLFRKSLTLLQICTHQ